MVVQQKLLLPQLFFVVSHSESNPTMGGTADIRKTEKAAQKY